MSTKNVKISEVLSLLDKGYSRTKRDDAGVGSLEEYYNLTGPEKKILFKHPKVKGYRRRQPVTLRIIDDSDTLNVNDDSVHSTIEEENLVDVF